MQSLSNQDYQKTLAFMDDMAASAQNDFRQQALQSFEKHFGFQRANFWTHTEHHTLVRPVMRNIDNRAMERYLASCHQHDILLPRKVVHRLRAQHVLRIDDILAPQEYEQSDYFNQFMSRHGYYHQMVAYLIDGGRVLGSIAFIRTHMECPFQVHDVMCLEILTRFLTRAMVHHEEHREARISAPYQDKDLTAKEREVLTLVQKGYGNEEIAARLFISINTVKKHLQSLYRKFEVTNRTSLCYQSMQA